MGKLKKALAAVLLTGGLVFGSAVTAGPAEAYTLGGMDYIRMYYASPYCYLRRWVDYNWWEESWAGGRHVDHWSYYVDSRYNRGIYTCPTRIPLGKTS